MALIDHVLVLAHLQQQVIAPPPHQSWEDTLRKLGMPEHVIAALPPSAREQPVGTAGAAQTSPSALDVQPSGLVVEIPWPCGCGAGLHVHHEFVLGAWAKHVAELEHVDADHLEKHAIASIEGTHPLVTCRCGASFQAQGHWPADALEAWERHVREVRA